MVEQIRNESRLCHAQQMVWINILGKPLSMESESLLLVEADGKMKVHSSHYSIAAG